MKLLINTSTLSATGAVQVAASFINECKMHIYNNYFVVLSPTVSSQIDINSFPANFKFFQINVQPRFLIKGLKSRKQLRIIEKQTNPDCVFSVFGPSWWSPKKPHLMGYAYPYYVYPESPFFNKISLIEKFKIKLHKSIHRYFLKKNGDYYVSETEDVSKRAVDYLGCNPSRMFTVSNTYNKNYDLFNPNETTTLLPPKKDNEFRFLSLCSFAHHKNLEILNLVIPLLKKEELNVKFVLTIDKQLFQQKFSDRAKQSIINLGRVNISQCPELYYECDALFLPTLMECFTANFPESWKMGKPIITSNLSFTTSVCEKAALYFDPLNPVSIVEKINDLISDSSLRKQLVEYGYMRLKTISSPEERAKEYLNICNSIIKNQQ